MEDQKNLYSETDIQTMRIAENAKIQGKNRVEEIKNYARLSGYKRIGIAYCIAFKKEAEKITEAFKGEFEVFPIDCYNGRIRTKDLLGGDDRRFTCNPAGQAAFLNDNKTELNIAMGLCMGHDILFNQLSLAPVTTLFVKDREYANNTYKFFENNNEQTK